MNELPQYYMLLSEQEKKNYITMLMSKGSKQQWVNEEAQRFGLKFLSEYFDEEEKRMLSESYKEGK